LETIANCSILHLVPGAGGWQLVRLNDVEHLSGQGETVADAG
jgi:hypothetical protein